jgi:nitronate monooxygenase
MGADLAYIGSMFIATDESNAAEAYKDALVAGRAADIVYTNLFTGVYGNYLRRSIEAAGLDPDNLPRSDPTRMDFGSGGSTATKAWRDIWGSGQGIGAVSARRSVRDEVDRLEREYLSAQERLTRTLARDGT